MKEEDRKSSVEKSILPFVVGVTTCLCTVRFIPKQWRVLPRLNGDSFAAGLVDGFGSVRYLTGGATGTGAGILTDRIGNKHNEKTRSAQVTIEESYRQ